MLAKGIVFNIQRFTVNDGPGIRTEVFLKGCPLKCPWCSNPESRESHIELGVYPTRCISSDNCGACLDACGEGCIEFRDGIISAVDRNKCTSCMKCAEVCPSVALKPWGEEMTVDEVMQVIRADKPYYKDNGGVTFSGGEPFMQDDFLLALLEECKHGGIHTCVESALFVEWEVVSRVLPLCDMIIADIKFADSSLHEKYTGYSNGLILSNLERLSECDVPLTLRIPLIPKINDNIKNAAMTADFIKEKMHGNIQMLQLLKYMPIGEEKYKSLGEEYAFSDYEYSKDAFDSRAENICKYFIEQGIPCMIGTVTKEN
ncbi:MAG: glycyl-radical enzyme activating protein [Eubacterium sp.]|nr:glycyl-radical enzyme activating protein [Eubacterium sp.]